MKRLILALICCLLLAVTAMAADVTVTRLTVDCDVEENGVCQLTQKLELHAPTAQTELTVPVGMNVSKIDVEGADYSTHTRDGGSYVTLKSKEGFMGDFTVTITCRTAKMVEKTEQGQTLQVELVSGLWETAVERLTFNVVLPEGVSGEPAFTSGYYGADAEDKLTVHTEGRAISGMLRGGLLDRDSFTMTLNVPDGTFTGVRGTMAISGAVQWILTALMVLLTAFAVYYWWRFLRCGRLRVQARTLPPDGVTPAELPYLLCGSKPDGSLLLTYWASLGYLTITESKSSRLLLRKNMAMDSERREEERKLFELLFGASDVCEAGSARWKKFMELTGTALRRYWNRRLFDRTSGNPMLLRLIAALVSGLALLCTMQVMLPPFGAKWLILVAAFVAGVACGGLIVYGCCRYMVGDWIWVGAGAAALLLLFMLGRFGGGMATMLLALALDLAVGFVTLHGGRLTASGCDMVEQSRGFRRFLGHAEAEHLVSMLQRDSQYYYQMLISAKAVGVEKSFAKRMGSHSMEPCHWITFADAAPIRADLYLTKFERVLAQLRNV